MLFYASCEKYAAQSAFTQHPHAFMLLTLFRIFSRFPLPVLHAIGAGLAWMVYLWAPGYRQRQKENITRAGFASELSAAVAESGKSIMELPFIWGAPLEKVLSTARVEDWAVAQDAIDAGQGVIFLTPHLGCYEIIARVIAARTPFTAMYRPPGKEAHKPIFEEGRKRGNMQLAPTNMSGVRSMIKALKTGNSIGLLPDHVPRYGDGVWAEFFGKPAYTMTLSAKLQQMSGARIILTYAERLSSGRGYVVRFVPFEEEMGETPEQQARAINASMEKLIARCPAQYFWSYSRYRQPAGAAASQKGKESA